MSAVTTAGERRPSAAWWCDVDGSRGASTNRPPNPGDLDGDAAGDDRKCLKTYGWATPRPDSRVRVSTRMTAPSRRSGMPTDLPPKWRMPASDRQRVDPKGRRGAAPGSGHPAGRLDRAGVRVPVVQPLPGAPTGPAARGGLRDRGRHRLRPGARGFGAHGRAPLVRGSASWSKWKIFSRKWKSSSRAGPRAPTRSVFWSSATGAPCCVVNRSCSATHALMGLTTGADLVDELADGLAVGRRDGRIRAVAVPRRRTGGGLGSRCVTSGPLRCRLGRACLLRGRLRRSRGALACHGKHSWDRG